MSVEFITSGTTPQRSDSKRLLTLKKLNKVGGIALRSDTIRLLRAKIDKMITGGGTSSGKI